ncbi:MAG TPA: SpoIIE family protein phosphatase [Acidimicrobiales bacterium]|nr:SpoIIE family protein phosphatase [Acidimicrobiales bacterium]
MNSRPPDPDGTAERLRQIENLTDAALAHLDVDDLLDELLERVRHVLEADTAAVLLLDAASGELVATAARGIEEEVRQGVRVPLHRGFAGRIAAERRPVVLDRVDETTVVNPLLAAKGIKSMAGVPLVDAGSVVGVLHVGSLTPREFTDEDVELLQLVADRVTGATQRGLAAIERNAVIALQRGLLPARLPTVHGLVFAARYVPGGGSAIGGDWYDVFTVGGGWIGITIGDVSGHGLHAAVIMGRMRSALRAYAIESKDPADVLSRLDAKLQHFEPGEMATVLYGMLDPTFETLRVSCAGHLPGLVVPPLPGEAAYMDIPVDPPIGVFPAVARHTTAVPFPSGASLCFFTDGLVEHRGEAIDRALDQLRSVPSATVTAERACADIMAELVGTAILDDDVALLVVQRPSVEAERLELSMPAEPAALGSVRAAARRWLSSQRATSEEIDEILLAVGEATSNVVEHAYGPDGGNLDVRFERDGSDVVVTVRDTGQWREPRGVDRGRGSLLMERCTDALNVDRGVEGTTVTLRRALSGAPG